ncbi:hypothetical protein G9C85_10310 [Halorubellus sp. JP-L1]|uniref:hypothetical protein n=1 Tax=Halorubellus sp. JP-L1 TaxID=2715753 RepID=UPI00140BD93A|nr:hypothetical protein [Halorubellus sp. JP-L1]NHN42019.1 hypothetical protein [Halorubellus sp. JP-L1]
MTLTEAVREQRERDQRDQRDQRKQRNQRKQRCESSRGDGDAETASARVPEPSKPVRRAIDGVSRDPRHALAFAVAAVVVALADVARILDPVGNAVPDVVGAQVSFSPMAFPSGTRVASLEPGALVGLELPWLVVALALAAVGPIAAGAATAWTVAYVVDGAFTVERAASTAAYAVAVAIGLQVASVAVALVPATTLPVALVGLWLAARLFPAPALAAIDRSPLGAASEAYALTARRSPRLALSVLGVGTLGATLASIPAIAAVSPDDALFAAGTAASYALAGTVAAVASAIYAVEARDERAARRTRRGDARGDGEDAPVERRNGK